MLLEFSWRTRFEGCAKGAVRTRLVGIDVSYYILQIPKGKQDEAVIALDPAESSDSYIINRDFSHFLCRGCIGPVATV